MKKDFRLPLWKVHLRTMFVWQLSVGRWRNIRIREQEVLAVGPIQLVEYKRAVYNSRRRTQTEKKRLQRQRSEKFKRSFPQVCMTGRARLRSPESLQAILGVCRSPQTGADDETFVRH